MDAINEQIDRNDLLASTRAVFVNTFADGIDGVIKQSAEALFSKADRSPTAQAQRRMLEARGVLEKKSFDIKVQMKKALEKLLHRSFQTTYSNYRPSFSNSLLEGPISLIDTSAFEDELRFNNITDRFRNEAGEQLRDLNIRIALLFEQDNIRERENPFRPYLFSRAILKAIESVDAPPELQLMLTDQLADGFVPLVPVIYGAVNDHLAENGIAAQLMMKPKRSAETRRAPVDDEDEFDEHFAPSSATPRRQQQAAHGQAGQAGHTGQPGASPHATGAHAYPEGFANSGAHLPMGQAPQPSSGAPPQPGGHAQPAGRPQASTAQASPVERLFSSVRALASRPFRGSGQATGNQQKNPLEADTSFPRNGFEHSGFAQHSQNLTHGEPGSGQAGSYGTTPHGASGKGANYGAEGGVHDGSNGQAAGGTAYGVGSGSGNRQGGGTASGFSNGTGATVANHGGAGVPGRQGIASGNNAQGGSPGGAGGAGEVNIQGRARTGDAASGQGSAGREGQGGSTAPYPQDERDGWAAGRHGEESGTSTYDAADAADRRRSGWLSGKKAVGDVLRRFFAGRSAPDDFEDFDDVEDGEAAVPRAAPGLLAGTVQRLIRHSTPSTSDMYSESGDIRNLIMERRSGLNEVAHNLKEQMTIDIVSMLFEFILRDTQVPSEVRAQLGRLQFLVLKIALRDESLLTTKAHPARMLVNRIGSISLGLKQVDPSGVAVTEEICRIVEAILADETENPNLFLKMLDDLDTFIARELLTQEKGVSTAVEAVEHAESRTLRLAHTSAQVSEALLGLNINDHLRDFLENDWSRAIEHAERNNPEIATEYRALIPDLLWSVLPKVSESDRQQLLALLPPILKTIHGGMEPIGWPAANKQTLMDWLFDAHTLVLRGNSTAPPPITFSAIHTHFQKFVDNPESVQPSAPGKVSPVNRKGYLDEALRELDARINMLDHFFDDDPELQAQLQAQEDNETAAAERGESEAEEKPFDITERLRVGVAIEVNLGGKPSTGRLNWINQNASNMVLTLTDQSEPSMISARMFQRLLRNDRVRFLEDEPIFERAVESLLSAAEA
jgi:hypothetical protein